MESRTELNGVTYGWALALSLSLLRFRTDRTNATAIIKAMMMPTKTGIMNWLGDGEP